MSIDSATRKLYRIVEDGLCIGCGICQEIAGPDVIRVVPAKTGYEHPVVVGHLDDATVEKIYDVCPGTRVDGLPADCVDPESKHDNVWGYWMRIARAWATDPQTRFEGSTGGVLTALAHYLLDSRQVDFILHARPSSEQPSFGQAHISYSTEDVNQGIGSRYGPTATLIDINQALARQKPFAFIGTPCDIGALRNYARLHGSVNEYVRYWLTPVCGGFMAPSSMNNFLQRIGIEPESVSALRYRGRGCPGPTRVEHGAGVSEFHYLDFWGDDESQWGLPFRCKICPDGIGDSADIAASDTWPGGSPTRAGSVDDPGTNAIIARTRAGLELMESAERKGYLTLEYDISPDELSIYQPHQMRKKYSVWARHQGMLDEGLLAPVTHGLRIAELATELPEDTNSFQRQGTRIRIRQGKVQQPAPEPRSPTSDS